MEVEQAGGRRRGFIILSADFLASFSLMKGCRDFPRRAVHFISFVTETPACAAAPVCIMPFLIYLFVDIKINNPKLNTNGEASDA
jgi:hypothetical protein